MLNQGIFQITDIFCLQEIGSEGAGCPCLRVFQSNCMIGCTSSSMYITGSIGHSGCRTLRNLLHRLIVMVYRRVLVRNQHAGMKGKSSASTHQVAHQVLGFSGFYRPACDADIPAKCYASTTTSSTQTNQTNLQFSHSIPKGQARRNPS